MVGPAASREAVAHLRNVLQMSERRACTLIAADRKMIRYRSRRPPDAELRARLRELANQRRRFGYRRLFVFAQGRRFRILNIVDDVTREYLTVPDCTRADHAILSWAKELQVEWHYIAPARLMQNGYFESLTAGCAMSFSMRACSSISIRPADDRRLVTTTTPRGRTPRLATKRRQPIPAHYRAEGRNIGRDSNPRWMKTQWQVKSGKQIQVKAQQIGISEGRGVQSRLFLARTTAPAGL